MHKIQAFVVAMLVALWPGVAMAQDLDRPSTVAVLVEPGLAPVEGTPSLTPAEIPALLEKYGLHARALRVSEIAGKTTLNPTDFPVLILPYGSAYPLPIREALRDYHKAGGCLIVSGFPFTHPCQKEGDKWVDLDHGHDFAHDATGLGTGGVQRPPEPGVLQIARYNFVSNPLGLDNNTTPPPPITDKGKPICLNPKTLDPVDEVIPLVEVLEADGKKAYPAAAIIRHKCAMFNGAIDIWMGNVASAVTPADAYFAGQMMVRGAAWCLREKGRMALDEEQAVFKAASAEARPNGDPSNLEYHPQARPWGDTFLPKSTTPANRLLVVNVQKLSPPEVRALVCLQALTSREQPRIWLNFSKEDAFWLDWHVQRNFIEGTDSVADWTTLFHQFASSYKGAIVPDPDLYRGDVLAVNVAACEDLIVATPELAQRLGIPVTIDLRGRFKTYADGMEWVWNTYKDRMSHCLCDIAGTINGSAAYPMQWRAPIFWPCGPVDAQLPGADMLREKSLVSRILSEMEPNTAMLGFPYRGKGVGLGEGDGVGLASSYGISLICSDYMHNECITSGVTLKDFKAPEMPPLPELEKDKIYIAMALSDGDNQNVWAASFRNYFEHPQHDKFPLAFGMGPAIIDLQPGVAQWYYDHSGPNTEFLADVSGIGYIQPDKYASNYKDPAAVFDGFLDWTSKYMQRMGMGTVRTVQGEDDFLSLYAKKMPWMHSIFADMGRYGTHEKIANLTYSLPDGMPVFRAATSWRYDKEGYAGYLKEVREQVGGVRPAFVNGFVHCWTYKPDDVAAIYAHRDSDMVFVTPAQLAKLYKQAKDQGWTK